MSGIFAKAILACVAALLLLAALQDVTSFRITNRTTLALAALFPLALLCAAPGLDDVWMSLAAGAVALAATIALFALGYVGGGDAKLASVIALWLGPQSALAAYVVAALAGGALAVFLLWFRSIPLPAFLLHRAWLARLHDPARGVPYGVALSFGALIALPASPLGKGLLAVASPQ